MAWVGYVCHDRDRSVQPIAWAGHEADYLKTVNITWADTERGQGPTGRAIRSGQPIACQNMLEDPKYAPWREAAQQRGYQSSLVMPLFEGAEVFATLNIYSAEADAFNPRELKLLTQLTDSLSFGILALRSRQKQQQTEAALRLSEEKFSKAFYSSPIANSIIALNDGLILDVNHGFEGVFGYQRQEVLGRTVIELKLWQNLDDRLKMLQQVRDLGHLRDYEARLLRYNGDPILCRISAELIWVEEQDPSLAFALVTASDPALPTSAALERAAQFDPLEVVRRPADGLALVAQPAARHAGAADAQVAALRVLHREHHVMQSVEQRFDEERVAQAVDHVGLAGRSAVRPLHAFVPFLAG